MRKVIFIFILILTSFYLSADKLTDNVKIKRLSNGLKVVVKEMKGSLAASVEVGYRVGFYNSFGSDCIEMPHFVEHMLFKGTSDYPKGEISRRIIECGGSLNAYTSSYCTVYHQVIPSLNLDEVLKIEASRMTDSTFDPKEIELEKNVLLSEIRNYANDIKNKFWYDLYKKIGLPDAGYYEMDKRLEQIKSITRDSAYSFYKKYYRPDNAVVVVAGGVRAEDVFALCEKYFGAKTASGKAPQKPEFNVPRITDSTYVEGKGIIKEPYAERFFNFIAPDLNNKDFIIASFITSSGFIPEIKLVIGEGFGFLVQTYNQSAAFPLEVIDFELLAKSFDSVKRRFLEVMSSGYESVNGFSETIMDMELTYGDVGAYDRSLSAAQSITFDDVKKFMMKYFDTKIVATGKIMPSSFDKNAEAKMPIVSSDNFTSKVSNKFIKTNDPEQVKYYKSTIEKNYNNLKVRLNDFSKNIHSYTLPNGMKLVYQQKAGSSKTMSSFIVEAGTAYESKPFVAAITSQMVLEGGPQILAVNTIRNNGGSWYLRESGYGSNQVSVYSGKDDVEKVFEGISLSVKNRKFNEIVFNQLRDGYNSSLKNRGNSENLWSVSMSAALKYMMNKNNPYYLRETAKFGSVLKIEMKDINKFYSDYYIPQNAAVYMTSAQDFDYIKSLFEKYFADWNGKSPAVKAAPKFAVRQKKETFIFNYIKNKKENIVRFLQPSDFSGSVSLKDLVGLDLSFGILSDGFAGRLMRIIRDERGLTYGINADYNYYNRYVDEYMSGYALASDVNVKKIVNNMKGILKNYRENGADEMEFLYFVNSRFNKIGMIDSDFGSVHNTLLNSYYNGLKEDWLSGYIDILHEMTASESAEIFAKYVDPEKMIISVAGSYDGID